MKETLRYYCKKIGEIPGFIPAERRIVILSDERLKGIFENLLKAKKFQQPLVHAGVKAQATLEGAKGGIELNPIATVYLHLPRVVHPLHAEGNAALRLRNPLKNFHLCVFRLFAQDRLQTLQHFLYCLQKNGLVRVCFFKVI